MTSLCGVIDNLTDLAAYLRSEVGDIHHEHVTSITAHPTGAVTLYVNHGPAAFTLADVLGLTGNPDITDDTWVHHSYGGVWEGIPVRVVWLEFKAARRVAASGETRIVTTSGTAS